MNHKKKNHKSETEKYTNYSKIAEHENENVDLNLYKGIFQWHFEKVYSIAVCLLSLILLTK